MGWLQCTFNTSATAWRQLPQVAADEEATRHADVDAAVRAAFARTESGDLPRNQLWSTVAARVQDVVEQRLAAAQAAAAVPAAADVAANAPPM